MKNLTLIALTCSLMHPVPLQALPLRGKILSSDFQQVIASMPSGDTRSAPALPRFSLRTARNSRLGAISSHDDYFPVLFAVKRGKKIYNVAAARKRGLCTTPGAIGLSVLKGRLTGMKLAQGVSGTSASYLYLARFTGNKHRSKLDTLRKALNKKTTTLLNAECAPQGNAHSRGITAGTSRLAPGIRSNTPGDLDNDGLPDMFDVDMDGSGIVDALEW